MKNNINEKTYYLWYLLASLFGGMIGVLIAFSIPYCSSRTLGFNEVEAQNWASEQLLQLSMESDKSLFFVVSYKSDGTIDKQLLCSHVRKDNNLKELVCEEYGTGDFYMLYFPVTITNVTLARDYIKFTNSK